MSEREILFRGKRADNGEWIEGYFLPGNERKSLHPCIFVYLPETQSFECFDIDIDTLGEYTGLTDKNGTRIFEHDILNGDSEYFTYSHPYGTIVYDSGEFLIAFDEAFEDVENLGAWANDIEVIGNIHDNLELLKGE